MPPSPMFLGKTNHRKILGSRFGRYQGLSGGGDPVEPFQRDDRSANPPVPHQQVVAPADRQPGDVLLAEP